jgi:hypothetical protein
MDGTTDQRSHDPLPPMLPAAGPRVTSSPRPSTRPVFVVAGDERLDQLPQVALVQDDDMVEKFPADCSNKPVRDPILPGAPVTGARWLDAAFGKRRSELQVDPGEMALECRSAPADG